VSRRDQITLSDEEIERYLDEQRVVVCATNGPSGWPHLMPLWYVVRAKDIWAWTFGKSQKVRNLERDARATLQVESGEQYDQLRGVMIEAQTTIHRDPELVLEFGVELFRRYGDSAGAGEEFLEVIRAQAAKRVALQFTPERTASWDHSKLGGVY
jgi:PPOX class probable F420-dependent enzyme